MSNDGPASQSNLNSTLYVSTVTISLAGRSRKTIGSIKLKKNNEPQRDVQKTICAGDMHQEGFNPPLALEPEDHLSVLVNCSWRKLMWKRVANISIQVNLHGIECGRNDEGVTSYRKEGRKVEVVVTAHQPLLPIKPPGSLPAPGQLLATTTSIFQCCEKFRILLIGNSGVGKSTLIHKVFGVRDVCTSSATRGIADIDQEFTSPMNPRLVVHDSLGFESGDGRNMELVKDFVARRKAMPELKDQLHAIWLCLETPYAGGRLLEGCAEEFLQRRKEILGEIPVVVVLTKTDRLDVQLELEQPTPKNLEDKKSMYMKEYCIKPLHKAAGSDVSHVNVSVRDGYSESLSKLVNATRENMAKYRLDEASRVLASIAQRISIKEKIESSIAVGKKKYWNMLIRSAVFRGHTLQECLQVIHKDVVTVWNFNDPDECLVDQKLIRALLRANNLEEASEVSSTTSGNSFADLLASGFALLKGPPGSRDVMSVADPTVGIAMAIYQACYAYEEAERDVKILMKYIVDLICVMQATFLLASNNRVTADMVHLVLRAYERPRERVHRLVDEFGGKLGVLPGGRDYVLEEIEKLIWCHSIGDHEIERLRRKIGQGLPLGSS